jgi:hypothetical protein
MLISSLLGLLVPQCHDPPTCPMALPICQTQDVLNILTNYQIDNLGETNAETI